MKKSSLLTICTIMMYFYVGFLSQTAAQGIRNEGATINIASGYVVCQGGLANNGAVTNNGTLTLSGGLTNTGTMQGNGACNLGGNWINNGIFNPGSGSVTFNGTVQTIHGITPPELPETVFNNLNISSTVSTTLTSGYAVTVGAQLTTNGNFIIESSSITSNGSLIVNGASAGTVTYNRQMRADDWHYFSSPVGSQLKSDFMTNNTDASKIWVWNEDQWYGTTDACWYDSTGVGYFKKGRGYNLEQTEDDGKFSFTGSVVNSAVSLNATSPYTTYSSSYDQYVIDRDPSLGGVYGGGGWNLLGNPFTSAMDGLLFVSHNSGSFDPSYTAVYLYAGDEGTENGKYYYIANTEPGYPYSGTINSGHIQAGQGFFVLARQNNVTFSFDPGSSTSGGIQLHGTDSKLLKSASTEDDPWPGLQLKVKYGNNENSTLVVYNEDMTIAIDPGYDVGQLSASPDVDIYTSLVLKDNSVNYARQALPLDGCEENIIPIGIDSEKGGVVTFSAFTVPLEDNKFWLEDRKTGVFTNLNSNTYTISLPEKTYGTGRFYIIASANTPTGIETTVEGDMQNLRIWSYDGKVIIKGAVSEGSLCEIYDTGGKKILMTHLPDGELNTVSLPSVSKGLFLVRVIDKGKVTVGKVVIL